MIRLFPIKVQPTRSGGDSRIGVSERGRCVLIFSYLAFRDRGDDCVVRGPHVQDVEPLPRCIQSRWKGAHGVAVR
jgi:hypothetical protein